jgi:trehalose 6-phosphate phosphatase
MTPAADDARSAAVELLRRDPARTAVLLDFDGTLAPIVDDPAAAAPLPGAAEVLAELHARYGTVAIVSGRPVAYLRQHLPAELLLVGLYGLERMRGGRLELHPGAAAWQPVVAGAVEDARRDLPAGVGIEDKGLSLTLHVRQRPELAPDVQRWAAEAEARTGLHVRRARMSTELHPPVVADKGSVAAELLVGSTTACFIGDDIGDLPAFAALDAFAAGGGSVVRVVVASAEAAPELLAVADVLLDGPVAALDLLRALLA